MKSRARRIGQGPSAIELVEEAVHLLRRTPPGTFCIYYAGSAPFALGLVFFWARTTWFQSSSAAVAWSALGLVVLFAAMKAAHADFCARLYAQRLGDEPPAWSFQRLGRLAVAQMRIQAWGILLLPLSLAIGVPFGWAYAYFQSASVLGDSPSLAADARAQAILWPGQNHLGQLVLSALLLAVWLNIAVAFWVVPWLANRLLGVENLFGFSGWWIANTTFLASTAIMSWLLVDPLIKAFFTLRVFYGRARRTGEDLRVELRMAQRGRRSLAVAALAVVVASGMLSAPVGVQAAESTAPIQTVDQVRLNGAIDRVLEGSDFRWRLRPMPQVDDGTNAKREGPIKRFLRAAINGVRDFMKWVGEGFVKLRSWLRGLLRDRGPSDAGAVEGGGMAALEALMWIFVVIVAGLLISVGVLAWHRRRLYKKPVLIARAVTAVPVPDLQDESTQAAQLPLEGWLVLAREQLDRGEWRLAWRALYLATLARLASQGLVSLAKSKTNLDYEREVRRRAISRQDTATWFSAKRGGFEAVWYGRAIAEEARVREWLAELEGGAAS
jgi:hypothetical protein